MPKILPHESHIPYDSDGFRVVERFALLKEYDSTWDLDNITVIHKLYLGHRITFDKVGMVVNKTKIKRWGPHSFECDACKLTRQGYDMMVKHQQTCKKMI